MTILTRQVISYLDTKDKDAQESRQMFALIIMQMLQFCYENAKRCSIRCEEVSGFVLYLASKFTRIVKNFQYQERDFEQYFFKIMQKRAMSYFSEKRLADWRRSVGDLVYSNELQLKQEEDDWEQFVAEGEPGFCTLPDIQPLLRIAMVCHCSSEVWKKRMTTYLLYILPSLDDAKRSLVCSVFNISEKELNRYYLILLDKARLKMEKRAHLAEILKYRYFRQIASESALNKALWESQPEASSREADFLKQNIKLIDKKMKILEKTRNAISQNILSDLFRIPRGTVASNVYFARILVECSLDRDSDKMKLLPAQVQDVLRQDYERSYVEKQMKEFSIDKMLIEMEQECQRRVARSTEADTLQLTNTPE